MDFLEKLLPFLGNAGAGGIIALALVWYLARRDSKIAAAPEPTSKASSASPEAITEAVMEIAKQTSRQTEILSQQTALLRECAQGHHETQRTLVEVKTRLEVMRGGPVGRA